MPPETITRRFQPHDASSVIALWNEVLPSTQPWNEPDDVLARKRAHNDDLMFVAEVDSVVVGAVIAGYDGTRGWIYSLAVSQQHRRCGIGRQLMCAAESALVALNCPKVNLQVRSANYEVLEFYRKCGYREEDRSSLGKPLHQGTDTSVAPVRSIASQNSESDPWKPDLYDQKHSYVWKLGASVIELLAPQPGERILDIGCGTGQLTAQIAESKAIVVGMDHSPAMIEEALRLYPSIQFQLADAHEFVVTEPFDAVFSNAALHWIKEPDKVVGCITAALKPDGRMAVEFGGHGNVGYLSSVLETASQLFLGETVPHPWYFPSIAEFASVLAAHGMEVTQAAMIDRPTPLEGDDGLRNWVRMFGQHWLAQIPPSQHAEFFDHVEELARPNLRQDSVWYADYRRIRVMARKT